jgi:hypothetical protein
MRKEWHADDNPDRARGAPQNASALKALGYLDNDKK